MKKQFLSLLAIAATISLSAQSEHNLVPNSSFEDLGKNKIREGGSVFLAAPWKAVTMNPVDLYSANSKDGDFGVPENKNGEEKARTGENYAGVTFFGYRGKMPRTYLGVPLTDTLEKGKEYCLKFHISMSDRSKYAVNNIGMALLSEELTEKSDANIYMEPQLLSVTNKVYDKQFSWTAICGSYVANGTENFLAIGNFFKDDDTQQETVRISRDIGGRQTYDAYYFIDDVSVTPTDKISEKDCACDKIAGGQMKVEYKSFGEKAAIKTDDKKITIVNSDGTKMGEKKPEEEIATEEEAEGVEKNGIIYKKQSSTTEEEVVEKVGAPFSPSNVVIEYELKEFQFPESGKADLMKIVAYLKKNPTKKITIVGHADASESEVKMIGKRRSILTLKEFKDAGISQDRIEYTTKGTTEKAANGGVNSRITFTIQ